MHHIRMHNTYRYSYMFYFILNNLPTFNFAIGYASVFYLYQMPVYKVPIYAVRIVYKYMCSKVVEIYFSLWRTRDAFALVILKKKKNQINSNFTLRILIKRIAYGLSIYLHGNLQQMEFIWHTVYCVVCIETEI